MFDRLATSQNIARQRFWLGKMFFNFFKHILNEFCLFMLVKQCYLTRPNIVTLLHKQVSNVCSFGQGLNSNKMNNCYRTVVDICLCLLVYIFETVRYSRRFNGNLHWCCLPQNCISGHPCDVKQNKLWKIVSRFFKHHYCGWTFVFDSNFRKQSLEKVNTRSSTVEVTASPYPGTKHPLCCSCCLTWLIIIIIIFIAFPFKRFFYLTDSTVTLQVKRFKLNTFEQISHSDLLI